MIIISFVFYRDNTFSNDINVIDDVAGQLMIRHK